MRPITVRGAHFFLHTAFDFEVPDVGVTLVVGGNGRGKTSKFLESVVWCVWGRTLRGTSPRSVSATTSDVTSVYVKCEHQGHIYEIERTMTARRTSLRWSRDGVDARHETTTKAQAALERELGDMETWVATSAFSEDDATMFTRSTDSQRKRLLEKLLGLEQLDAAAAEARAAASSIKQRVDGYAMQLASAERAVQEVQASLEQLEVLVGDTRDESDQDTSGDPATALNRAVEEQTRLSREASAARVAADQAQRAVVRTVNGLCHACGQVVPEDLLAEQQRQAREAHDRYQEVLASCQHREQELSERVASLRTRLDNFRARQAKKAADAKYATTVTQLEERLGDLYVQQLQLQTELDAVRAEQSLQDHVVRVLGTRGARATILQGALNSITELANAYLTWLSPGLRVRLLPYTQTATGTSDQFSLVVEGPGAEAYKAASKGERRRLDVALVLAMAQLRKSDIIICDDLFDALDAPGVDAVCRLLVEIAQRRPVIVLTHTDGVFNERDVEQVIRA